MNKVLERAVQHYAEHDKPRVIEVPEWGDESGPLRVHVWPANLKTRNKIYAYAKDGSLEALVESLILRARDEDKLPIFSPGDRELLMTRVDPEVIARVVQEINSDLDTGDEDIEAAEKN